MEGIFGIKGRITQCFDDKGRIIAVTPVKILPHKVIQELDGGRKLVAISGMISKRKIKNNSYKGILGKFGLPTNEKIAVKELSGFSQEDIEGPLNSLLINGSVVHVTGITKGKGFTGAMKRWGFHGGPASHGASCHRSAGALQGAQDPGKVMKNKKMAGRDGGDKVVQRGLRIVRTDDNSKIIWIKGSIPGHENKFITITPNLKSRTGSSSKK